MDVDFKEYKLPVVKIFKEALQLPLKHYAELLRFALPLIILLIVAVFILNTNPFFLSFSNEGINGTEILLIFSSLLAYMVALVLAVIGAHRAYLLEPEIVEQTKSLRWTMRETKFVGWWFLLVIIVMVLMFSISFLLAPLVNILTFGINSTLLTLVSSVIVLFPFLLFVSKFSLLFPATAIDIENTTLSNAWNLSYGNSWRLTLLVGVLPALTNTALEYLPVIGGVVNSIIYYAVWLVVGAIEIGLLSLSYAYLARQDARLEQES